MGTRNVPWIIAIALAGFAAGCHGEGDEWVPIVFSDKDKDDEAPPKKKPAREERASEDEKKGATTPAKAKADPSAPLLESSDVRFLRERARAIHATLVASLPAEDRKLLANVPLGFEGSRDVNAFAACTKSGGALIALTDGILQVQAQLARARAADEVAGGHKLDAYLRGLARGQLVPARGFLSAEVETNARKRARQAQLFEEGVAYVIGHELAHHRLSHTGCVGADRGAMTTADVNRALSNRVPLANQPNELAADVYGIQNVLTAGRESGSGWREDGALLMLRAFQARSGMPLEDALVFGFERTHPHPEVRIPVVEQTATAWRLTGGRSLPPLPALAL
jgi:hypothetical protein